MPKEVCSNMQPTLCVLVHTMNTTAPMPGCSLAKQFVCVAACNCKPSVVCLSSLIGTLAAVYAHRPPWYLSGLARWVLPAPLLTQP